MLSRPLSPAPDCYGSNWTWHCVTNLVFSEKKQRHGFQARGGAASVPFLSIFEACLKDTWGAACQLKDWVARFVTS